MNTKVEESEFHDLDGKEKQLHEWRLQSFVELGCGLDDASLLAWSRADLGLAREYVARGCKPELLARLLV